MVASVEEVAASLVREYLSRKGLKRTIACMDEEHPRTDASINNRSDLRQILHMEGLYKRNKTQGNPLKSMLEIIVKFHTEGHEHERQTNFASDLLQKSLSVTQAVYDNTRRKDSSSRFVGRETVTSRSLTEVGSPSRGVWLSTGTDRYSTLTEKSWTESLLESGPDQQRDSMPPFQDNDSTMKTELMSDRSHAVSESSQKSRMGRIRRGMMAGPIVSSTEKESNRKLQTRKLGVPNSLLGVDEDNRNARDGMLVSNREDGKSPGLAERPTTNPRRGARSWNTQTGTGKEEEGYGWAMVETHIHKPHNTKTETNGDDQHMVEMSLDDIDGDEELEELSRVSFQSRLPRHSHETHPMDQNTAIALKEIILGSSTSCFNAEWRSQSFTFLDAPDVRYGIVQKKGGPCGVLASIQAFVLKKLLFEGSGSDTIVQRLRPSNNRRTKCLALAVAEILWQAGEGEKATIAVTSGRNHFIPSGQYRSDGILEKITCTTVDNISDLQLLLDHHIHQFESGSLGCILMTISAVLSRSIARVRDDMDVSTTTLLGAHGYCTQELVNLLLCGRAVSNVFDNDMELDSGNGNLTLLRGISRRGDIGLLSLFEHYSICKVGSNLKTPRFPIWVVCSESHFSVLFGLQRELSTNQSKVREFDLHYFDGLANQKEEIRLTVSLGTQGLSHSSQDPHTDLTPPLEHCIRTKWSNAVVNWNDTEPII